jgi:pimeloyl-ACP methyl ester carboxylesterase
MHAEEHVVEAPDGRRLRVLERGVRGGLAVIEHHGTPGSAGPHPDHVPLAVERGARLIAYDRPGYGGSDADPGRTVASAAADVAAIADALEAERFVTWGLSGGGPHALACAALLGDRVAGAAALASIAPPDADGLDLTAGMGEENVVEFGHAMQGRAALDPYLREMVPEILASTVPELIEIMRTVLGPPDLEILDGREAEIILGEMQTGLAPGHEGWLEDDLVFVQPWGFDVAAIDVPVLVMQGEQDLMVPGDHGRWLGARIPGAELRVLPEEGHLTLTLRRMPEILDWLLGKL